MGLLVLGDNLEYDGVDVLEEVGPGHVLLPLLVPVLQDVVLELLAVDGVLEEPLHLGVAALQALPEDATGFNRLPVVGAHGAPAEVVHVGGRKVFPRPLLPGGRGAMGWGGQRRTPPADTGSRRG